MINIKVWLTYDNSWTHAFKGSISDICMVHFTKEAAEIYISNLSGDYEIFEDTFNLTELEALNVINDLSDQLRQLQIERRKK